MYYYYYPARIFVYARQRMWRVLGSLCVAVEESLNGFCRRMFEYGGRFGGGWMGLWDGICIDDSVQILEGWK